MYSPHSQYSQQAGYAKDLALVGRDLNNVLIIENTPDCVRGHEENGILVSDYEVWITFSDCYALGVFFPPFKKHRW